MLAVAVPASATTLRRLNETLKSVTCTLYPTAHWLWVG